MFFGPSKIYNFFQYFGELFGDLFYIHKKVTYLGINN